MMLADLKGFRGWARTAFAGAGRHAGLRAFAAASLLLAGLALTGCFSDEKVAGGDDFPNSVETLGKAAAGESSDTSSWNAYDDAPSTPPEAYDSTEVPDEAPSESAPGLGRRAVVPGDRVPPGLEIAGSVRSVLSLLDSLTGLNRAVRVQALAGIEARDTTWFRLQGLPLARRMVRMSGVVTYPTGRVERFVFEDADGDSLLSPQGGRPSLARARFVVEHALGRVEERTVVVSTGPDRLFATRGDNVLRALETVQRVGADTVYHLKLSSLPGDSVVRDPQRAFTRVDVEHVVKVGGVRVAQSYRARLHADSARNRALRFRREVTTAVGVTEVLALGRDSAADFAPGDTGLVRVTFTSTRAGDTLASSQARYRVVIADSAAGHGANRLREVHRDKVFRFGAEVARAYRFVPTAPAAPGALLRAGEVDLRVDLRAGGWIGFVGTSSSTGFQGVWTSSDGQTRTVRYDVNGAITAP